MSPKILIFHLNQLGDFLFALPLLSSIKAHWSKVEIHSVIRPSLAELARHQLHLIDRWIVRNWKERELWRVLAQNQYDRIFCLSESPETMLYALCAKGKKIGFTNKPAWKLLLDKGVLREGAPSAANNLNLLRTLGIEPAVLSYERLLKVPVEHPAPPFSILTRRIIVVHPGCGPKRPLKGWPAQYYRELALLLLKEMNCRVILTGNQMEHPLGEEIMASVHGETINLIGKTTLIELANLFQRADLVIANDSGASHLAAAVGTPTLSLFGPSDPQQTRPHGEKAHVLQRNFPCQPCLEKTGCRHNVCLDAITPQEVLKKVISIFDYRISLTSATIVPSFVSDSARRSNLR